jgi:hypothetical protein
MITITCNLCGKKLNIDPVTRANSTLAAFKYVECTDCAKQKLMNVLGNNGESK